MVQFAGRQNRDVSAPDPQVLIMRSVEKLPELQYDLTEPSRFTESPIRILLLPNFAGRAALGRLLQHGNSGIEPDTKAQGISSPGKL
jgi:hypothetical protein